MKHIQKKGKWIALPGIIGFLFFYIFPFIRCIYYSMIDNTFNKKFVGLHNYIELINNKYFRLALKNTLEFTLIGVPLLIVISFIIAVLITMCVFKNNLVDSAFFLPILIPTASIIIIWQILFGDSGYILKPMLDIAPNNIDVIIRKAPVFLLFVWKNSGYNIILFTAGIASIPKDVYEAATLDGAKGIKKHLHVTVPLLIPTFFFVAIISLVNSFKIFKEIYLLYGSYPDESIYVIQHYMNNQFSKLNYPNLTTSAILFAFLICILILVLYKIENSFSREVF